jgi:hypothetical protein
MALEPLVATGDEGPNVELVDMTRRFWVGLVLTLPVFVLAMAEHLPGVSMHEWVPRPFRWIQFALSHAGRVMGGVAVLCSWLEFAGIAATSICTR